MFIPSYDRVEVKPLGKESVIIDDKQELVELGEIVSIGNIHMDSPNYQFYKVGEIIAFEGWGATKISYKGEDRWVVSTDKNVILGKFTKEENDKQ